MSYRPHYVSGDWNAVCDACGKEFKASKLVKRWDGLMVCKADWEPRHPQDFVRAKADLQAPVWTRPDNNGEYIGPVSVYRNTEQDSVGFSDTVVFTNIFNRYFESIYDSSAALNGTSMNGLVLNGNNKSNAFLYLEGALATEVFGYTLIGNLSKTPLNGSVMNQLAMG